jgi:hypothetical protein
VVAVTVVVVTVAAAPESTLTCAGEAAATPEATGELAAMAAAAIASGAVALPDGVEAAATAGTPVSATGAAIATATAFCSVIAAVSGDAEAAVPVEDWLAEVSPEAGLAVDFPAPFFEPVDFVLGCWTALAVESELASEDGSALALRASELLLADGSAVPASRERPLSEAVDASLERRGGAGCSGAEGAEGPLLAPAAALLSTSAPKLSFP